MHVCFGGSCLITSETPWIMRNSDCNHSMLGTLLYTYYFLLVYIPSSDMWVSSMVFSCPHLRSKKQIKIKTTSKYFPWKTASSKWSLTTYISELFIFFSQHVHTRFNSKAYMQVWNWYVYYYLTCVEDYCS